MARNDIGQLVIGYSRGCDVTEVLMREHTTRILFEHHDGILEAVWNIAGLSYSNFIKS